MDLVPRDNLEIIIRGQDITEFVPLPFSITDGFAARSDSVRFDIVIPEEVIEEREEVSSVEFFDPNDYLGLPIDEIDPNSTVPYDSIVHDGDLYVAGYNSLWGYGLIWRIISDGTWELLLNLSDEFGIYWHYPSHIDIIYGNIWAPCRDNGLIELDDGNWILHEAPGFDSNFDPISMVDFNDQIYLAHDNNMITTYDGTNWEDHYPWSTDYEIQDMVEYDGDLYCSLQGPGSDEGGVWVRETDNSWTEVWGAGNSPHKQNPEHMIVWNSKLWLCDNTVDAEQALEIWSFDGASWTNEFSVYYDAGTLDSDTLYAYHVYGLAVSQFQSDDPGELIILTGCEDTEESWGIGVLYHSTDVELEWIYAHTDQYDDESDEPQVWGSNDDGQIGTSDGEDKIVPTYIDTDYYPLWQDITDIEAGYSHTLAVLNGELYSWGNNDYGQLGLGDKNGRDTPTRVGEYDDWEVVGCGYYHSFGIRNVSSSGGELYVWGRNDSGQLGLGDTDERLTPVRLGSESNWRYATGGEGHSIASRGTANWQQLLYTWGSNEYGQLGLGDNEDRYTPVQIVDATSSDNDWWDQRNKRSYACGRYHTVAFTSHEDNLLFGCGYNEYGQLGLGDNNDRNSFEAIDYIWQVGCGEYHTAGLGGGTDNSLYTWGRNNYGQLGLGDNDNRNVPSEVLQVANYENQTEDIWISVGCGINHTLGVIREERDVKEPLWTFGRNNKGQIGTGDTEDKNTPQEITTEYPFYWNTLSGGEEHSVGVKSRQFGHPESARYATMWNDYLYINVNSEGWILKHCFSPGGTFTKHVFDPHIVRPNEILQIILEGEKMFEGPIVRTNNTWINPETFKLNIEAQDYTYMLDKHMVVRQEYPEQLAGDRIKAIINDFARFFANDLSYIDDGPTLPKQGYDYQAPSAVFDDICGTVGYHWYIDFNKRVHFFADTEDEAPFGSARGSPIDIDTELRVGDIVVEEDISNVHNVVILKDYAQQSTNTYEYKETAEEDKSFYSLPMPPWSLDTTSVKVDGEERTLGLDPLDGSRETIEGVPGMGYLCIFNWGVRFPTVDLPSPGDLIEIDYDYEIPDRVTIVIDRYSIREMARRSGADGKREIMVSLPDFRVSGEDLVQYYGNLILKRDAWPTFSGTFTTFVDGWHAGQYFYLISDVREVFDIEYWVKKGWGDENKNRPLLVWVHSVNKTFMKVEGGTGLKTEVSWSSQPFINV